LFVVCVVGKLLYSSSSWWAIVAQYKDFKKKSRESWPLLTTVLQTANFLTDTIPSLHISRLNRHLKILNSWIGFGSNRIATFRSEKYSHRQHLNYIATVVFLQPSFLGIHNST